MTQPEPDSEQTVVDAPWNTRLNAALEEERRLQEEADQDTQEDKIIEDGTDAEAKEAELAATLARVEQLRAQKVEKDVRRNAVLRQPQSETIGSVSQGESSFVSKECQGY